MPRGPQICRQPDRPAPEEDRVARDRQHHQPEAMIAPDAAHALEDTARRVVVVLDRTGVNQIGFGGVDGRMLLRLVAHQKPDHRQRQDKREQPERIELSAPAEIHDQRRDQQPGQHRADHGADPPIGCRLAALAQRKPVGNQRQRHRITGRFAHAQSDARREQHAVARRQSGPETRQRPDHEAHHCRVARSVARYGPAPDRRGEAIGNEHARGEPAEQLGLSRQAASRREISDRP